MTKRNFLATYSMLLSSQLAWICLFLLAHGLVLQRSARAETTNYSGATALTPAGTGPYTTGTTILITTPGTYYLTRDVVYTGASGNAIQVSPAAGNIPANNVTIDLNGHTVSNYAVGQAPNPAVDTAGIAVLSCSNSTVINGRINGFLFGVFSNDPNTAGHRVENVQFSNNSCVGAYVNGNNSLVRRCIVNNTGGSTRSGIGDCHGILMVGASDRVVDCDLAQVVHGGAGGNGYGITFSSSADGVALNNRISQTGGGLYFVQSTTAKYRNNLFGASVATKVVGSAIDAGGNL